MLIPGNYNKFHVKPSSHLKVRGEKPKPFLCPLPTSPISQTFGKGISFLDPPLADKNIPKKDIADYGGTPLPPLTANVSH